MSAIDTHQAFEMFIDAGFSKEKADALVKTMGVSFDSLATKTDLEMLRNATKSDLDALEQRLDSRIEAKADLVALLQRIDARFDLLSSEILASEQRMAARLKAVEQSMTIRTGAMLCAGFGLVIAVLVALELLPL